MTSAGPPYRGSIAADILLLRMSTANSSARADIIRKRGSKWLVLTESGDRVLGEHDTEEAAQKQLGAIEASQARSNRVDFLEPLKLDSARVDETTGFMTVDARLTRTGVFVYEDGAGERWGELRTDAEVFSDESMKSFHGVVVTNEHPDGFVTTDNVKRVQVGHVGTDVRRDGDYLRATVTITDPDTIQAIKDGKVEVSCGYTAEVVPASGTFDGQRYSAKQTRIRGNHLAVVEEGRAGPGARLLLDAAHSVRQNRETPMTDKIKKDAMLAIGEREFEVPEEVANMVQALMAENAELKDMAESAESMDMEGEKKPDMMSKDMEGEKMEDSALRAKVDSLTAALEKRDAEEANRIDARVGLVAKATEILGAKFDHRGKSDDAIRRAVVLEVQPQMAERLERNAKDGGYLRAAFDHAVDHYVKEQESLTDSLRVTFDAASGSGAESLEDDYQAMINRRTGRAGKDKK